MGTLLRSAFGRNLVIIGTTGGSSVGTGLPQPAPLPDSIDSGLASAAMPRFVIDLRAARADASVSVWLSETRQLRVNLSSHVSITPATSFDALFFVDKLTRAHRPAQ